MRPTRRGNMEWSKESYWYMSLTITFKKKKKLFVCCFFEIFFVRMLWLPSLSLQRNDYFFVVESFVCFFKTDFFLKKNNLLLSLLTCNCKNQYLQKQTKNIHKNLWLGSIFENKNCIWGDRWKSIMPQPFDDLKNSSPHTNVHRTQSFNNSNRQQQDGMTNA